MVVKTGLGQDSHRFEAEGSSKPLILGGVTIGGCPGLAGNSDADVVLHALTNAVSGVTGVNVLGSTSDDMCKKGVVDSAEYLRVALQSLDALCITHVSVSIEAKRPHLSTHIPAMKQSLARLLSLTERDVGITATSGEGLTAFGRGEGIQAFVVVTAMGESRV